MLNFCYKFSFVVQVIYFSNGHVDPAEYFQGSQQRPRLEILYPENGQIHDNAQIEIKIQIEGYTFPSQFHDSYVCIGVGTAKAGITEECFEPARDLIFHATGLSAGETYSLRVVFLERKKAIAVSVRSFRVAAILGLLENKEDGVTIQTALQMAIRHQSSGIFPEAEKIYRTILSEYPTHSDTLHLFGLIFYQKGDAISAIPYIQRALSTNQTYDRFYNSLGECFRTIGRLAEAKAQFEIALSRNPNNVPALFNLGLTLQATKNWDLAIEQYRKVLHVRMYVCSEI